MRHNKSWPAEERYGSNPVILRTRICFPDFPNSRHPDSQHQGCPGGLLVGAALGRFKVMVLIPAEIILLDGMTTGEARSL